MFDPKILQMRVSPHHQLTDNIYLRKLRPSCSMLPILSTSRTSLYVVFDIPRYIKMLTHVYVDVEPLD
jgi:hypothetical protein